MPPPTPAQFKLAIPSLRMAPDALVQTKIEESYLVVGPSWGPLRDVGARYYAAHLISVDPLAEPSRGSVKTNAGRTVFLAEYERLLSHVRIFGTSTSLPENWEGATWPPV